MDAKEEFEANALKIANYLDGRMNPSEEEGFMQELSNDKGLRNQYEEELHIHALLTFEEKESGASDIPFFQSADEHIRMIETALRKGNEKKASIISIFNRYRNFAAILLVLIASGFIVFIINRNKYINHPEIAKKPAKLDTSKIETTGNRVQPSLAKGTISDSVFRHFYKPYSSSEEDPVEISNYYIEYKKGKYAQVLSATEADYRVMGSDNKAELLKQYMHLYKGLSYMEENEPANAILQFDSLMQTSDKTAPQYYQAQWYSALCLLKKNDLNKAVALAKKISQSPSLYRQEAGHLAEELKIK
jgi:hypothetical protein